MSRESDRSERRLDSSARLDSRMNLEMRSASGTLPMLSERSRGSDDSDVRMSRRSIPVAASSYHMRSSSSMVSLCMQCSAAG
jgi:hypothetical protein